MNWVFRFERKELTNTGLSIFVGMTIKGGRFAKLFCSQAADETKSGRQNETKKLAEGKFLRKLDRPTNRKCYSRFMPRIRLSDLLFRPRASSRPNGSQKPSRNAITSQRVIRSSRRSGCFGARSASRFCRAIRESAYLSRRRQRDSRRHCTSLPPVRCAQHPSQGRP